MKLLSYIFLVTQLVLSACVSGPPPQSMTDNPLVRVAAVGEANLFAADPDGRKVAIVKSALSLFDLESDARLKLSSEKPVAVAWSPDGLELAAAYAGPDYATRLLIYSKDGMFVRETLLPVSLSQMVWSARGDLLVTGFKLKVYSFGGNLRQSLFRVDGDDIEEILLSDSTLRPSLVTRVANHLSVLQPVAFSPSGDELTFLFLHDPPEFPPYLQIAYRNWQSAEERTYQRMPLQDVFFAWSLSGDSVDVIASEGSGTLRLWQPISVSSADSFENPYRFIDGRLYKREELLADWGEGAQFQLLDDGRFLLAVKNSLYLGDGLQKSTRPVYNEKEWNLRRWRYEGLINQKEYLELLKENDK